MNLRTQVSLTRFAKTVAAAIVTQMLVFIAGGIQISSVEDLKRVGYALIATAITGAILGVDKFLRWDDSRPSTPENLPISNE
jgi:uncharacterized membrane protein YoaK (UPF0700 family)